MYSFVGFRMCVGERECVQFLLSFELWFTANKCETFFSLFFFFFSFFLLLEQEMVHFSHVHVLCMY